MPVFFGDNMGKMDAMDFYIKLDDLRGKILTVQTDWNLYCLELEKINREQNVKINKIKKYALGNWVSQKMWDELEKEL